MKLGIDFGTTHTVVSVVEKGNTPVVHFETSEGDYVSSYPSLVVEQKGEWKYGLDASVCLQDSAWTPLTSFKQFLSDPAVSVTSTVHIGGSERSLLSLLTSYLKSLKEVLLTRSTLPPLAEGEKLEVMIATPAQAHNTQRFLTMEAFRQAGFVVDGLMSEPAAAAIEYLTRYAKSFNSVREHILVYDLGGGTLDVSLLQKQEGFFRVCRTRGLSDLGGRALDQVLLDMLLRSLSLHRYQLSAATLERLLEHCREQKEAIHPHSRKLLLDPRPFLTDEESELCELGDEDSLVLSVGDFYEACVKVLQPSLTLVQEMLAEENEELPLAGVYVVGGATALPVVYRLLRESFGRRLRRSLEPMQATAIGLALAQAQQWQVEEQLARHFGVFRELQEGAQIGFDVLMPADTVLPVEGEHRTISVRTYQPAHNIGHYRYIECQHLTEDGVPDGEVSLIAELLFPFDPSLQQSNPVELANVPIVRGLQQSWVEERYEINDVGLIEVVIRDLDTGYTIRSQWTR
jgi:molecular chaperone DnaK (HSP70)